MAKIRASLTSIINSEDSSSTYYRIAYYLLKNNYVVNRVSIQDVADNCFCSKSTISRFCRTLGYEDYFELNQDLYASTQKSQDKFDSYIKNEYEESIETYYHDLYSCIDQAKKTINKEDVFYLVKQLHQYKTIGVFGNLQSHSVGQLLQEDLGLSRKVITASSLPEHQKQFIRQSDQTTCVIIVSCSGSYFRNFIDSAVLKSKDRPKLILITTNQKMLNQASYDKVICLESNHNYVSEPRIIDIFFNLVAIQYAKSIL